MLRTEEEMKADRLLFLSHLLADTPLLCFESKGWLLTTFPFSKDCLGAGLLSPARKTSLQLPGFLEVKQSFIIYAVVLRHLLIQEPPGESMFQFRIWFSWATVGNWVHLAFNDLEAKGLGKLCRPPPIQQAGALDVQVLRVPSSSSWTSVQRLCNLLLLFLMFTRHSVLHRSHTCFLNSTKSLRKALRQSTCSRCFDTIESRKPFLWGHRTLYDLGKFPSLGPAFLIYQMRQW